MSTDILAEIVEVFRPAPSLTPSDWMDANVFLPESSAARGARWRTHTVEPLREFINAAFTPGVRRISLMKAAQCGASQSTYGALAYAMVHRPCPMLMVLPTQDAAQSIMKNRINAMIQSSPAVRAVVQQKRGAGRPESTLGLLQYRGGFLKLGPSNSPQTFAEVAIEIGIMDDADRAAGVVGEEGDPVDLLTARTTTFANGRVIIISTPTLRNARIDTLYTQSDQRRWFITCPRCERLDWITWNDAARWRVAFDDHNPVTVRLACPCGHIVREPERMALIRSGHWKPTNPVAPASHRGYHVPAMLSPFVALPSLAAKFLEATQRGREALRVFINTSLAEPWEDEDHSIKLEPPGGFMNQRESYAAVPHAASWITASIDIQDDRFELLFCAWGNRDEVWALHHQVLTRDQGYDPYDARSWDRLYHELLGERAVRFTHVDGATLPVNTICVDSGFQTPHAYRFSRFAHSIIFPTKGVATLQDGHLIKFSEDRDSANRARRAVALVLVNTDAGKQRLSDRIRDGRVHFPIADWCSDEFFAQLTAETCEPVFNPAGVRVGQKWVKQRPRNEILDLMILNLAARAIRGTQDLDLYRGHIGLPPVDSERRDEPAEAIVAPAIRDATPAPALVRHAVPAAAPSPPRPRDPWLSMPSRRPGGWLHGGRSR
jgi:phage terminase large subunit GpA-like protein